MSNNENLEMILNVGSNPTATTILLWSATDLILKLAASNPAPATNSFRQFQR
jgi:hypothetical protein